MSTEVKRYMRAAHQADPEAFDALVRDYIERGAPALAAPKPGSNAGRPQEMNDTVRALFLARFLNRAEHTGSERKVAKAVADKAEFWRTPAGYYGVMDNENTVRRHVRDLKARCEHDEAFREKVDSNRRILKMLDQ